MNDSKPSNHSPLPAAAMLTACSVGLWITVTVLMEAYRQSGWDDALPLVFTALLMLVWILISAQRLWAAGRPR